MGRKKKNRIYFGKDVEKAIVEYLDEKNPVIKNKIYEEKISQAIDKLCENIINTFKFSYFDAPYEDIKQEVISFIILNLHKFDPSRGFKAFSYFSVVAKNYLIAVNNANYKKLKIHEDLDAPFAVADHFKKSQHDDIDKLNNEFLEQIIKYLETYALNMFKKKNEIDIIYSIIELLKKRTEIDNFNKKSLYILIREMTGLNTSYITGVINKLKNHYMLLKNEFFEKGHLYNLIDKDDFPF